MKTEESEIRTAQVSDFCRRRLLNYADSFSELAKSYESDFCPREETDRGKILSERRLWEDRQVLRSHLNEMARIMTQVADETIVYQPLEEKKKKMLIKVMKEEGILLENPCYLPFDDGKRGMVVTMRTEKRPGMSAEDATDMISVLMNKRLQLSVNSPYMIEKKPHLYRMEEEAGYIALTGFAKAIKEGEKKSGDNYTVIEAEKGKLAILLSDGTGSGETADRNSGHVLDLMEKFIEAGYSTEAAIRMLNVSLFAIGEDDNHPTLDVCDIDLHKGTCALRKVGGALSFLKRDGHVEILSDGSLPLGIFRQLQLYTIERKLKDGDYLIMVTDGVIDAFKEESYEACMAEAIGRMTEKNPGELAEHILRSAIVAGGGKINDDMTVGVIGIWESDVSH